MVEVIWEGKLDKAGAKVAPVKIALSLQTVETINESTQERQRRLERFVNGREDSDWRNRLIWGDKKYVLPALLKEFAGKANLIYIDPPFATGANFSYTATIPDGGEDFLKEPSVIEQKAYRDTWGRGLDSYLQWFYESLVMLRELLADDGSIYVHLDPGIGHYAKCILDEIFGVNNFRNEIVWQRTTANNNPVRYGPIHDTIFYYTRADDAVWNIQYGQYAADYLEEHFVQKTTDGRLFRINEITGSGLRSGDSGKPWRGYDPSSKGRHWAVPRSLQIQHSLAGTTQDMLDHLDRLGYIDWGKEKRSWPRLRYFKDEMKGVPLQDMWTDIYRQADPVYPTQKPDALLERIIKASTTKGDLVLDCFCGSGTTAMVAEKLERRWIVGDLSRFAIHTTRKRLLSIPGVRPFVIQNLGKYERQVWQAAEFGEEATSRIKSYVNFIVKLYGAEQLNGYMWLHGKKRNRFIHVGSVDSPVSPLDVGQIVAEFKRSIGTGEKAPKTNGIDVLGWDFAFELNELAKQQADQAGVDIRFMRIPREVLDKKAVEQGDVHFFELASLDLELKISGHKTSVIIKDFVIPLDDVPSDIQKEIRHWSQWIDYWAIDWDNRNDTFHNEWQAYRTAVKPKLATESFKEYSERGEHRVVVKIIDILGNDTTKMLLVKV